MPAWAKTAKRRIKKRIQEEPLFFPSEKKRRGEPVLLPTRRWKKKPLLYPVWKVRARLAMARGKRKVMKWAKKQGFPIVEEKPEHPLEKL
jgi:hypothetical protein